MCMRRDYKSSGHASPPSRLSLPPNIQVPLITVPQVFRHALVWGVACAFLQSAASWPEQYTAQDAANHIGEIGTVCGLVVSPKFAMRSKGQLTFLHLDRPYPNHIFTVVIWGKDRPKFGRPDATFAGKRICVHGLIADYEGRPEMMATDPAQITSPNAEAD